MCNFMYRRRQRLELDDKDREFLDQWAEALGVTVAVLIMRIVQATIDGDQYLTNRPENDD